MRKIKLFIVCSTLGIVQRGLESFTQECFDALSQVSYLDIYLFKGGGSSTTRSLTLWKLKYGGKLTKNIDNFIQWISRKNYLYLAEELSFFISLLPYIVTQRPDVILFSEYGLGSLLQHWRNFTKQNYKLLFSNGAPTRGHALALLKHRFDYVQQVTPYLMEESLNSGVPVSKQCMIPYGVNIQSTLLTLSKQEQEECRRKLGLPIDRQILISVGAIRKYKRVDYLIYELAALPTPRPYLLLLGQISKESDEIIQLATCLLGSDSFQFRTVSLEETKLFYNIADAFVLAALNESFGRVYVEASAYGLPCMSHDYETARFVLGDHGYFADFSKSGELSNLIPKVLDENDYNKQNLRHLNANNRFSWSKLLPKYVEMIELCLQN